MKLASLFDGIGGFPLAATRSGIIPVWASEIEKVPVEITKRHFPNMKHYGDVTKIQGAEVEPVDVITFGSPCQDLSVAGKRAGLDGERSGLFGEAIRIIREMRIATNGTFPRFAVWENVPGAFSSNGGQDFRTVIEELVRIRDSKAEIPMPADRWEPAGLAIGKGYSLGWRTLDAQYWGVPQRRRRIFLVVDFAGQRAGEVLFEPEGLRRDFATGRGTGQGVASDIESRARECLTYRKSRRAKSTDDHETWVEDETANTINCFDVGDVRSTNITVQPTYSLDLQGGKGGANFAKNVTPPILSDSHGTPHAVAYAESRAFGVGEVVGTFAMQRFDQYSESDKASSLKQRDYKDATDLMVTAYDPKDLGRRPAEFIDQSPTLKQRAGTGGNNVPVTMAPQYRDGGDVVGTLSCNNVGGWQRMPDKQHFHGIVHGYKVRRLTPLECTRLQGYPDEWLEVCYANAEEAHSAQILHELWKEVGAKAFKKQGWRNGIIASFLSTEILLAGVHGGWFSWSVAAECIEARGTLSSEKHNREDLLRELWVCSSAGRSPYQRESFRQLAQQLGYPLPKLPLESAQAREALRSSGMWEEAQKKWTLRYAFTTGEKSGQIIPDTARYKALGNSVAVPCVEFILRGVAMCDQQKAE
jgi:DNA (cytosine-5)-methyltransferase 1